MINPADLLTQHIENQIEKDKSRKRSGKWNPSSFGRCFRLQYWSRKNKIPSNPPSLDTIKMFRIGNIVEDDLSSLLPKDCCQVKVDWEDVFGYADYVDSDDVVDFKTAGNWQWKKVTKLGYDIAFDNESYVLQVMSYAIILGKEHGHLLFIQKDTYATKLFSFKTEEWRDRVDSELFTLRNFWNQDKLPPPQPRAYNGKDCNYCQYLNSCIEQSHNDGMPHPTERKK